MPPDDPCSSNWPQSLSDSGRTAAGVREIRAVTARTDRRAARTRRALAASFVALVRRRGYDSVRVAEVCDAADVGRSTFYAHYAGKDDLKRRAMAEHLRGVVAGGPGNTDDDPLGFSLRLLMHAREHMDLYRATVGTGGERVAAEVLAGIVRGEVRKALAPERASEAAVVYVAGGWLALHDWWLARGAQLPPAEVDAIFRRLAGFPEREASR